MRGRVRWVGLECVCVCVCVRALWSENPSFPSTAPITPAPRTSFSQKCPNWPHGEVTQATSWGLSERLVGTSEALFLT